MTTAAAPAPPQSRCPSCGVGVTGDQRFCIDCGRSLVERYRPAPSWRLTGALGTLALALIGAAIGVGIGSLVHVKRVPAAHVTTTVPATPAPVATPPPAAPPPAPTTPRPATPKPPAATKTPPATARPAQVRPGPATVPPAAPRRR